jgi:PhnB protein
MTTKPYVPPNGRVLTPYICCRGAAQAIEWYRQVFGARLTWDAFVDSDGRIGHAELEIDGAVFMLSDGYPESGVEEPAPDRLPTYSMHLYLPDVGATVAAAERAGATIEHPPADTFYGSRSATIIDPYGVRWMLATHLRQVSEEDIAAARADFAGLR